VSARRGAVRLPFPAMSALALSCAVRTDTGPVRPHNEDAAFATPRLAAVADGVGGHAAGEVASRIVIGVLAGLEKSWVDGSLDEALARAVADGNDRIALLMECRPETAGMGTTLTAVALHDDYVVANIGDSRTYLLRDGELRRLTRDDSYLQELLDAGVVSPEAARAHPHRNLVTAALDGAAGREPTITRVPARAGDRLLLCSDGVSDVLDEPQIAELLAREDAADALVRAALEAGARDNVTAVVADAVAVEAAAPWVRD
jgi:PPM family protein phosphatase